MIYWSYECSGWEESHMADVYKQSFKQNYTNNIELSIFNCGLERCAPGQTWGPGIRDHYLIHLVVSGKGSFEVGGHAQIWGRIQSREYVKKIEGEYAERRTAYEVSVSKLEWLRS